MTNINQNPYPVNLDYEAEALSFSPYEMQLTLLRVRTTVEQSGRAAAVTSPTAAPQSPSPGDAFLTLRGPGYSIEYTTPDKK